MTKYYELTDETREFCGRTLYRIRCVTAMDALGVAVGDLGGWVQSEANIAQNGRAWAHEHATVCAGGTIEGGTIWGGTIEGGTIWDGTIEGGTIEGGTIWGGTIEGGTIWDGTIEGGTIRGGTINFVLTAQRSDGYMFVVNPTEDVLRVTAGCRYFTFPEAREHWERTRGGTLLGDETMAILDFLEGQARRHGLIKEIEA